MSTQNFNKRQNKSNKAAPQSEEPVEDRTGENRQSEGKGKKHPSRNNYQQKRVEDMRERKGAETMKAYNDKIKAKWMPGLETAEKLEARVKETANQRAQMLSITTRGIGVNLSASIFTSVAYKRDLATPNIYSLYRVCLAVLESKVQQLKQHYPLPPRFTEAAAMLNNSADFERICRNVVFLPTPIVKLINSVGILKIGTSIYLPVIAKDVNDNKGRLIPCPETVRFGNLRKIVETLSNVATPERYRRSFRENNTIPGAIWKDDILINPNDIMPVNYTLDDLSRDAIFITPWISSLQKHVPRLVGNVVNFESTGKISMMICNDQETLRLPDRREDEPLPAYYERCIPEGNITTTFSPYEMAPSEKLDGQLSLLGERPLYGNFKDPLYTHRLESRCDFEYTSGYLSALQLSFGF